MTDLYHHVVDLDLQPAEASGLVASTSAVLRERTGLDPLYWTVLDDGPVENCLAVIGQRAGTVEPTAGWSTAKLDVRVTTPGSTTDDGEAIAVHDGWVYVLGSAYGSKEGPLEPARSFVARFHEDDVVVAEDGALSADLHVTVDPFALHRVVNDALHDAGVDLIAFSRRMLKRTVGRARKDALDEGAPWAWRLAADDHPINIEGAAFTSEGHLLLGLRLPVTRMGEALLVEVLHPERLFDPAASDPEPGRVVVLRGVGARHAPVGVRDLHLAGGELHVLLGDLDSDPSDSVLLAEHPEGGVAESIHMSAELPDRGSGDRLVLIDVTVRHHFEGLSRVEGLAADPERGFLYVSDEDETIRTRFFTSGDLAVTGTDA